MVKLAHNNYNSEYNALSEKQDILKLRVRLATKQIGLNFPWWETPPPPTLHNHDNERPDDLMRNVPDKIKRPPEWETPWWPDERHPDKIKRPFEWETIRWPDERPPW